jgi:hypothetical protein
MVQGSAGPGQSYYLTELLLARNRLFTMVFKVSPSRRLGVWAEF